MAHNQDSLQKDSASTALAAPIGPGIIDKAKDDVGVKIIIPAPFLAGAPEILEGQLMIANKKTGVTSPIACESGFIFQINNLQDTEITTRPGAFARNARRLDLQNGTGAANLFYNIQWPNRTSQFHLINLDFPS